MNVVVSSVRETRENEVNMAHGNEVSSELTTTSFSESKAIPSLLDIFRSPKLSEISRKKKIYNNTCGGTHRKTRSTSSSASEPKTVRPQQRLKQYPNEPFDISAGTLFCKACREELSLKSSSLSNHIKSTEHRDGKQDFTRKKFKNVI